MSTRSKLLIFFSTAFIVVLGVALFSIYYLSTLNRKQEFYQRLKDRSATTFKMLIEVNEIDHDLLQVFDKNTINSLYDEKSILFDSTGKVIYSSVDDTKIFYAGDVLETLKKGEQSEIKYTEGEYEVYGQSIIDKGQTYYAIAKAYDKYGRNKISFLGFMLLAIFIISLFVVVVLTYYLAKQLTRSIIKLTDEVSAISVHKLEERVSVPGTSDEVSILAKRFNELLSRVDEVFLFQKNFINHLSHELRTPLTILITNIEKNEKEATDEKWLEIMKFQKYGLMQISEIINALLEISKFESGKPVESYGIVRLDELIFECFDELKLLYSEANFELTIQENISDAAEISIKGNERMAKIAFYNILKNAIEYSDNKQIRVIINKTPHNIVIQFVNKGPLLNPSERKLVFRYFFRGENSRSKGGFGLGLAITSKIVTLHKGTISYEAIEPDINMFTLSFPLS